MEDALAQVRAAAQARATKATSWADIEAAANVTKQLAEAEKATSDTSNARRQLRLQGISALSALLIPLVSLIALCGTVFFQMQQLKETRLQTSHDLEKARDLAEDTQWRDLLTTLRGAPNAFDSDVTVAPRLRSFFTSPRYGEQAKEISIRLMGRLTSVGGFKDLFRIAFPQIDAQTFPGVLEVGRSLNATRLNIETECASLSVNYKLPDNATDGLCTLAIPLEDLIRGAKGPFPPRVRDLRQAIDGVYTEIALVSQAIATYLRANDVIGAVKQAGPLDLSSIYFTQIDLANIDFTKARLNDVVFWNVRFDGADLLPASADGAEFDASNWWDAHQVDQTLLLTLIRTQYPLHVPAASYLTPPVPTVAHYNEQITRLCQPPQQACAVDRLLFKPP